MHKGEALLFKRNARSGGVPRSLKNAIIMVDRPEKDMYGALVLTEPLRLCQKYDYCFKTSQKAFKVRYLISLIQINFYLLAM